MALFAGISAFASRHGGTSSLASCVRRAHYDLDAEARGEQFDGLEEVLVLRYESPRKPVQSTGIDEAEDVSRAMPQHVTDLLMNYGEIQNSSKERCGIGDLIANDQTWCTGRSRSDGPKNTWFAIAATRAPWRSVSRFRCP